MTIFAARRVLPPDLIVPADASAPRMKDTGPLAVPPPSSISALERILERLTPAPEPPLKMMPSSVYQLRIERIESSTERMKQALPAGHTVHADVEPDRRVEGRLLGDQEVLEFGAKGLGLFVVDEVVALDAPGGDGVDDAVGHLLEAGLALIGAEGAAKVLLARMLVALNDQLEEPRR